MTTKMVKKDYYSAMLDMVDTMMATDPNFTFGEKNVTTPVLHEFIVHEMKLLEKKNASRSGKPTKNQAANVELMDKIYETMEPEKQYRVSEIAKFDFLTEYSANKVNALVRGLKLDGRVGRTEEKGIAYFTKI